MTRTTVLLAALALALTGCSRAAVPENTPRDPRLERFVLHKALNVLMSDDWELVETTVLGEGCWTMQGCIVVVRTYRPPPGTDDPCMALYQHAKAHPNVTNLHLYQNPQIRCATGGGVGDRPFFAFAPNDDVIEINASWFGGG